MIWAKFENSKVTGVCSIAPPMGEDGAIEPGWEQRSEDDPAVQEYYAPAAPQPQPDWDQFFNALIPTLIQLLSKSSQPIVANFLQIEFGKRPDINVEHLKRYWNGAIAPIPPTAAQIQAIQQQAAAAHLPVTVNAVGAMVNV